jgi:mevalonate kinase
LDKAKRGFGVSVESRSDIPVAAELGSSAAVATSTAKAVGLLLAVSLSRKEIMNIAFKVECIVQGKSSGIDPGCDLWWCARLQTRRTVHEIKHKERHVIGRW